LPGGFFLPALLLGDLPLGPTLLPLLRLLFRHFQSFLLGPAPAWHRGIARARRMVQCAFPSDRSRHVREAGDLQRGVTRYVSVAWEDALSLRSYLMSRAVPCSPPEPYRTGLDSILLGRSVDLGELFSILRGRD